MPMTSDKGDMERALFLAWGCRGLPASPANRYEGREADVLVPPDTAVPDVTVPGERQGCSPPDASPSGGRTR